MLVDSSDWDRNSELVDGKKSFKCLRFCLEDQINQLYEILL